MEQNNRLARVFLMLVAVITCFLACGVALAGPTSDNNPRLRRVLGRFPQADANHDGVLTLDEALRFRERHRGAKGIPSVEVPKDATAHKDLRYGPHERNVLDIYLPDDTEAKAPLVIYIHGGGFIDGDKSNVSPVMLKKCIDNGIAVAAVNYRFITTDPFPASLHDCARALQFLRAKANEYKLDSKRFAVYGGSAGGGTSLWLALHDDLADPDNEDPVLRESTRVCAAGAIRGQSSYNPIQLHEWLGDIVLQHRSVLLLYGANDLKELLEPSPERLRLFEECSAIHHVSGDDPPIILFYSEETPPDVGGAIHSKVFGEKLKAAIDAAGGKVTLHLDGRNVNDGEIFGRLFEFFKAALVESGENAP